MVELTTNLNLLHNPSFAMVCDRAPTICRNVVDCTLPSVSLNSITMGAPFGSTTKQHSDRIVFSDLSITVALDEDWYVMREAINWVMGYAPPVAHVQYQDAAVASRQNLNQSKFADVTIIAMTNKGNSNLKFLFVNCVPVGIDPPQLNNQIPNRSDPLKLNITFSYERYEII